MDLERSPSLRAFSRYARVSPSTVSRVFTKPELVAVQTREHVLKLARRTGFRPSPIARAAMGGATRSVGVLLSDLTVSYFADITLGIQTGLLAADYLPVVLSGHGDGDRRGVQRLFDHRVDAMILDISDESVTQAEIDAMSGASFPLVLVDQPHPGFTYDCVLNDDEGGGYQAGVHLAELGHRRCGFVRYGEQTSNCVHRLSGFRRGLAEHGLKVAERDIVQVLPRGDQAVREQALAADLHAILTRADRPTAIFAATDMFARNVYTAARAVGLRVPQELSVIGFADLQFAALIAPPLTTIRQNGREIGRQAAELVMSRLAEPARETRRVVVPTRLVVRESTAAPGSLS